MRAVRTLLLPALALLVLGPPALLAGPARAGAPGDGLACLVADQLAFVRADGSPCAEPESDGDDVVVDASIPERPVCTPELVPDAALRAYLTVIADDTAASTGVDPGSALTVLLEIRGREAATGEQRVFVVADSFVGSGEFDLPGPGLWNQAFEENEYFQIDFRGGRALAFELAGLDAKLVEIGTALGLPVAGKRAVLETAGAADRKNAVVGDPACVVGPCGELEVQEPGALASVSRWRLTVRFAETRPPAGQQDCEVPF